MRIHWKHLVIDEIYRRNQMPFQLGTYFHRITVIDLYTQRHPRRNGCYLGGGYEECAVDKGTQDYGAPNERLIGTLFQSVKQTALAHICPRNSRNNANIAGALCVHLT